MSLSDNFVLKGYKEGSYPVFQDSILLYRNSPGKCMLSYLSGFLVVFTEIAEKVLTE